MADMSSFNAQWTPRLLSVLRMIAAFMFMQHGGQKLFNFPPSQQPSSGSLEPMTLVAGVLELFGGLLMLLGLFTRPVAFLLSGQMAVAYFMRHAPNGFWPLLNRGELAALYCFVFLYLCVAGGGAWSLDQVLGREKTRTHI